MRDRATNFNCPICTKPVRPKDRRQRTCLADLCVKQQRLLSVRRLPEPPNTASNEAKRKVRAENLMALLREEFGKLSRRELRILRAVYQKAHTVGYQRGIHARRKMDAAKVAA
jgi:hypothetical protein